MLKYEFEELTGLSMTEEEFNGVNALYMACGDDTDKGEFCMLYMDFDGRLELMHRIERERQQTKEALEEHKLLLNEANEIRDEATNHIMEIEKGLTEGETFEHSAEALEKLAWWLVGTPEVIKRKVRLGLPLKENEICYITNNLK